MFKIRFLSILFSICVLNLFNGSAAHAFGGGRPNPKKELCKVQLLENGSAEITISLTEALDKKNFDPKPVLTFNELDFSINSIIAAYDFRADSKGCSVAISISRITESMDGKPGITPIYEKVAHANFSSTISNSCLAAVHDATSAIPECPF